MSQVAEKYGAIEAGGTKFICAVGAADGSLIEHVRISTRDPDSTLAELFGWFAAAERRHGRLSAFGVGAFGPLELRPAAPHYGFITTTPKSLWRYFDLLGSLRREFERPVAFDTDVNAAALGELRWGAAQGLESLAYVTVGTGIGAGIVHHGRPVHGLMHPEIGHAIVRVHPHDREFGGICPFHGDCLEGLACGPAIQARTGRTLSEAGAADPIWTIEADYLGQLAALLVLAHSPQILLFGGGVMEGGHLHGRVHARMHEWLRGYLPQPEMVDPGFIRAPALGEQAGIRGALALALTAAAGR
jgi:fructokinase